MAKRRIVKKILIVYLLGWSFCLCGCIYTDEPMPRIINDNTLRDSGSLRPENDTKPQAKDFADVPAEWIPPRHLEKKWKAIVIHHSATKKGSAAFFHKAHRKRLDDNGVHWKGVGYDFVIGNGSLSGNGRVEVTFRWKGQIAGAHCGGTKGNWANRHAIGICLVGDFNNTVPTSRQMKSLLRLVGFLQKRYNIPKSRVYGHNTAPGARPTDCPGKRFPMAKFKTMLGS